MENHAQRARECLNRMVKESLEAAAYMRDDLKEWKHQWRREQANSSASSREPMVIREEEAQAGEAGDTVSIEKQIAEEANHRAGWCIKKILDLEKRHQELASKLDRVMTFITSERAV